MIQFRKVGAGMVLVIVMFTHPSRARISFAA